MKTSRSKGGSRNKCTREQTQPNLNGVPLETSPRCAPGVRLRRRRRHLTLRAPHFFAPRGCIFFTMQLATTQLLRRLQLRHCMHDGPVRIESGNCEPGQISFMGGLHSMLYRFNSALACATRTLCGGCIYRVFVCIYVIWYHKRARVMHLIHTRASDSWYRTNASTYADIVTHFMPKQKRILCLFIFFSF